MTSPLLARIIPLAILFPVITSCGQIARPAAANDAGSRPDTGPGSSTGSGSCSGSNPGCCGFGADGCNELIAQATCSTGTWTCPAGDSLGPACSDICMVQEEDAGPDCGSDIIACCPDECSKPVFHPTCSASGWTCPSGSSVTGGGCACLPDAGSGCGDTNPGCCGLNPQGCEVLLGMASCQSGAWVCSSGDSVGPTCSSTCEGDAGEPGAFSCLGFNCDAVTQYCLIDDSAGRGFPKCEPIPAACANGDAGVMAACTCTLQQLPQGGQCSENGNAADFTITVQAS